MMFLVEIFQLPPAHKPWLEGRDLKERWAADVDEGRANFLAGARADALHNETGAPFDYEVTPLEVRS